MGVNERLQDLEKSQATQAESHRLLDIAVTKVCGAVETAMQIQTEHSVHLRLLTRIVYGAVAVACIAVGGAMIDMVVRSQISTAHRIEQVK